MRAEIMEMKTLFEDLAQVGTKVELEIPQPNDVPESYCELVEAFSEEQIVEMATNKKTDLFKLGILGIKKPSPEEVKFKNVRKFFKFYWYIKGYYLCKWLNETSYPIPVAEDVLAVKHKNEILKVKKEPLTISEMFEKIGINLGPISIPSSSLISGVLKTLKKDEVIGSKSHIILEDLIELRQTEMEAKICLDALTGAEDEEVLELISKTNTKEAKTSEIPKISKTFALEKFIEKFNKINQRIEGQAEGIIERKIIIQEIKYTLVPWYEVIFEMNQQTKSWKICAVSGKMQKQD